MTTRIQTQSVMLEDLPLVSRFTGAHTF